ncbi:hypothetical protein MOE49_00780 [Bacillus inaquosorum]|uniref:hypothetical protein n=1 Tax=Bacillus inaquosorum TaxID=483913 RepID=UPI002281083C|nr:hypothetical protein [Bacillus inaquosorum]MCY9097628.1 hypothetical protein [Bacillus inaquosorum]
MLKIDRSAVDKAIENLDNMFNATNEVLKEYEAEKKALKEREEFLKNRLAQLQEQHAITLMDREVTRDNPSDYIYLSKQLSGIDEEVEILLSLQEQLQDEYKELKEKYMPIIRDSYRKDLSAKNSYFNINDAVNYVRDELKQAISDYENEIYKQDSQVMSVIYDDFLSDSELMNESWDAPERRRNALSFKRAFDFDRTKLSYDREIKL